MSQVDPLPIRPNMWRRRTTTIYAGNLIVKFGRRSIAMTGTVNLDFSPTPRVGWSASVVNAADGQTVSKHNTMKHGWPTPSLPTDAPINMSSTRMPRSAPAAGTVTASGPCEGIEVGDGRKIDRLVFQVVNGPELFVRGNLRNPNDGWWCGRWTLADNAYQITIDHPADLSSVCKKLKATGGFAFTHVGEIRRIDGSVFDAAEAKEVLHDLFLFLTFIRASTVGIVLPVGYLKGVAVWRLLSSGICSRYTGNFGWPDLHAADDVAALWPKFRAARIDLRWNDALMRAVLMYTEAAQARSSEVTVAIAQAGLELLGTAVFVDRDATHPFAKWDTESAPWRIRKLLQAATISLAFPKQCKGIAAVAKHNQWGDTAAALAEIRNTVTHWSTGKPAVDTQAWVDACQLAVHYLELSILWSLGYTGRAFDRIRGPLIPGAAGAVPWHSGGIRRPDPSLGDKSIVLR